MNLTTKVLWTNLALCIFSMVYISCQKSSLNNKDLKAATTDDPSGAKIASRVLSAAYSSTGDPVVDSMIRKYNLVQLTSVPYGFKPRTVTTIADGSAFFDNVAYQTKGRTQTGIATKAYGAIKGLPIVNIAPTVRPYGFESADPQHMIITINFGNWSSMNISFDYLPSATPGVYSVSNQTASVSGFTFGIGYQQTSSRNFSSPPGGNISFAINGNFSAGISAPGGVTFGYSTPYYYSVSYNPSNLNYSVTEGKGSK